MGVCGAGKSLVGQQLAGSLNWEFAEGDDFHPPVNLAKMKAGIPLDDDDRQPWLQALQMVVNHWIQGGVDGVLTCSALKASYRHILLRPSVELVYLQGSFDLIQQRLRQRQGHFMPPTLLSSQFDILEEPQSGLHIDIDQPPDRIVYTIQRTFALQPK